MKSILISDHWFLRAPFTNGEYSKIDLPHDGSISLPRDPKAQGRASNGFFQARDLSYTRFLRIPAESPHAILDIDGAYMCAEVVVNDHHAGIHPHGYTPFLIDISRYVRPGGVDKLRVMTSGIQPSTRWYSGCGIYRDVLLWLGGAIRIEPRDTFVWTESASESRALVRAKTHVAADHDADVELRAAIFDDAGREVAARSASLHATAGEKSSAEFCFEIADPALWDMDSPRLHSLRIDVFENGTVIDSDETTFGIRTISFDARNGFRLNGRTRKLRGGCIHHDHAVLGAAAFPAAEERKVRLLRDAGFNALRIAHNPPSRALLEVCDRLGIVLFDEAFDMWVSGKNTSDYHLWFRDWWERDIEAMVIRDRNHPCVIGWSIGNEIHERHDAMIGGEWAHRLAAAVRAYDATRPVTSAFPCLFDLPSRESIDPPDYEGPSYPIAELPADKRDSIALDSAIEGVTSALDIVGYNYLPEHYVEAHERYPERVMWGSETWAIRFHEFWEAVKTLPYLFGDFTWTAYDNLGEAGTGRFAWARDGVINGITLAEWPWRSCYQGDLDLCGYRRPQSYHREAIWIGGCAPRIFTTHPSHADEGFTGTCWHFYDVHESWTFGEEWIGKPVRVEVYTDAEEIEFIANGRSMGRVKPVRAIAAMEIPYEPGMLESRAFKDGEEAGKWRLETTGAACAIAISPERARVVADNRDLAYVRISVVDSEGRRIDASRAELHAEVDGAELLGIFSGDPANLDNYTTPDCHAFDGRALAVLRSAKPGKATINVSSQGLVAASASIEFMRAE